MNRMSRQDTATIATMAMMVRVLFLKGNLLPVEADAHKAVGAVRAARVAVAVGVVGGGTLLVVGSLDASGAVAVAVVAVLLGVEKVFVGGVDFFAEGATVAVITLQHTGLDDAQAVVGVGDEYGQMVVSIHHAV